MTDSTEPKQRTITLTDRPPVRVREDQWPLIAVGMYKDWDNQYECQANRTWHIYIRVRRHQLGRAIVYGRYSYDTAWQGERGEMHRVGTLLAPDDDLAGAIRAIASQLIERVRDDYMHPHIDAAADECIANLPAQAL